jgi:capsid protein
MQLFGDPGETLDGFSPNVPNPEFFEHARLLLTIIGINLGLPLVMVLMDSRESNFSAWRGAVQMAQAGFRSNQKFIVRRFMRPDYRRLVRRWASLDPAIRAAAGRSDVDLFAHKWALPAWPYIDPLKDAGADLLRVRNALISQRRRAAERNLDWEDLTAEIVEDNSLLIERAHQRAEELNAKYPALNVTWREVASLPTPDGVTVTAGGDAGPNEQDSDAGRRREETPP